MRFVVVAFATVVICNSVWAQGSIPQRPATESVKEAVRIFYNLITKYQPLGIPKGETRQSLWPLLSSRLARKLDMLQACEDDYHRPNGDRDRREQLKAEIGWAESGLFSGAPEAASPSSFVITKVLPKPNGSFEVHLRFTYKNTYPYADGSPRNGQWDYRGIVYVVLENGRYLIDDFVPLYGESKPYRALSQRYEGCRGGKWVGIDYKHQQ